MSYVVNQNSVITSLLLKSNSDFLTCGGTNLAPKSGTWNNFTVSNTNFQYIFNSKDFVAGTQDPKVTGLLSSPTGTINTIKQFLYDNANIEYICGQFSLTSPVSTTNIMYFNPTAGTTTGSATFITLGVGFTGTTPTVNCMTFLNSSTELLIAGNFATADAGGSSNGNIALFNVSGVPGWTINTSIIANATINASTTIINSMVVVDNIIYVAGVDNTTSICLFYSYDTLTNIWSDLLSGSYAGTINILKKAITNNNTYITIGGQFTDLGTATGCNNIVLYNISDSAWIPLGSGVTGTGATPITATQVFALEYNESANILWVGGYFLNAAGVLSNSIATCNISAINIITWSIVQINDTTVVTGLLKDTSASTDPGVVYALTISNIDTANIIVGGSFRTKSLPVSPIKTATTIYNLVKITLALVPNTTKRNYTKFNSKSQ